MDVHTPTDYSVDDEESEPDNNTHKRQRKVYAPVDTNRKELTKLRQAQVLKNQQEKERLKAQTLEDRDQIDRVSRTKSKRQHNLKMMVRILMILTAPDHIGLKEKHPILIKSRVQKRIEKC